MGLNHTVSGDIAHFRTPSRVPLESLTFHFLPKQEGSGDPSPSNVRSITGWTGLNGRRAGKNIGHIIGYSAVSMNSPAASKFLTNGYGTTINTMDFVSPDTPLVVTQEQTSSWDPENPASYKNGYFCVGFDNLIFDKSYDFSFKISNILSNPFGVNINNVRLNTPGGGQKNPSEVKDGNILVYKNMKWVQYTSAPDRVNRCTLEFRNCGMSFTVSEIMVTPANTSDGVFEPYSGEQIPITFPDGQTIYGGYIDLVYGELVVEWLEHSLKDLNWGNYSGNTLFYASIPTYGKDLYSEIYSDHFPVVVNSNPRDNETVGCYKNGAVYAKYIFFYKTGVGNPAGFINWINNLEYDPKIVYKLETPIHILIPESDIKSFLDHNNFWSDANDITEVTYAVTESKDILETRKKAATFEAGHHKICEWNQLQMDGNFTDSSKWEVGNNYGTLALSDNIGTWTCTTQPTQFYQTGIRIKSGTDNSNFLSIPWNHKVLVRCFAKCSVATSIRIYGLVTTNGNAYSYAYNHGDLNLTANEWTKICGFISNRPETPPSGLDDTIIKRFKLTLRGANATISTITVGTTLEMKNFMAFDLTQMLGLGNEPSTVEEFERICRINGIDLDTYQPYDEGSDRWLIIP